MDEGGGGWAGFGAWHSSFQLPALTAGALSSGNVVGRCLAICTAESPNAKDVRHVIIISSRGLAVDNASAKVQPSFLESGKIVNRQF